MKSNSMSRKNNKKIGARPQKRVNNVQTIERMEHPPQIDGYEITHYKRLRFTVNAAVGEYTITYQNLLDAIIVATGATVGFDLFDVVRVMSLEVWSQAALGTPSTVTVAFVTATGDRSVHTDTSLGIKPAYVKAVPSRKSLASFWQSSAAGNAFYITCPAGSIVDVNLLFRTADIAPVQAQTALVGATVGELYYRGLDGVAIATTQFPPVAGLPAR